MRDWMFKINNTILGRFVLWYLKRCFNRDTYKMRRRSRHSDRVAVEKKYNNGQRWNYDGDIPVRYAEYWAIYIDRKDGK
jgi:hypothetical protein